MKQQIVPIICLALFGIMALTIGQVCGQVVITPPNPTIQPGESVTLNATGATFLRWSPPEGLSTTVGPTTVATPNQTTTYTCFGYEPGEDKVVNGDFEQGNVGFTSDYIYSDKLVAEGTYNVGSDAQSFHYYFHGTGHNGGKFMVVNGATNPNSNVWTEQIQVQPDTYYVFTTWVCTVLRAANISRLQFCINGTQIGPVFTAPDDEGIWDMFYQIWYSGNNTSAIITILNQNTGADGNDFGLDDITFCELIVNDQEDCTVTVEVLSAFDDNAAVCSGTPVEIDFLANDGLISVCDSMTCSIVQQPANGVATYQNNVIRYTPNAGYEGPDTFRYRIACGSQQAEAAIRVTVFPVEERTIEEVACDAYPSPWCDSVYTQSGTYSHRFSTVHGCDSIVRLHLTINPSKEETIEDAACDAYQSPWCDSVYTQSGTYSHLFSTVHGCDSLVRLHLTINPSKEESIEETACDAYQSPWCDSVYTQSGTYTHRFSTVHGCDSIVRLHLTINPSKEETIEEVACDSYPSPWCDSVYTQSGTYSHRFSTVHGCDSIVRLHLTINPSKEETIEEVACDSYPSPWCDSVYTQSGTYSHLFSTVHGCDSLVRLHLTINPSKEESIEEAACDAYQSPWCDSVYTQSGTYTHRFSTVHGCDSIVRLHLTINPSKEETIEEVACDSYPSPWCDSVYTQSGTYSHRFSTVHGCDSIVRLHLTINPSKEETIEEVACDSYPSPWCDSVYTQSGTYTHLFSTVHGCDSLVRLHLTINPSKEETIEAVGCNEYNSPWCDSVYTQSGTYTHHYSTVHGCDSVVRLHLTILTSETVNESDSACVLPYHWQTHGHDLGYLYDYGHHTQEVVMGDCYTTFNLDLTEQAFPAAVYFTEEACDSFFWQDSLFTQSTQYEVTVPQASGCDSTYVLDLTLHHSQENDIEAVGCNEYNSPWCDSVYTQSGIYTHHYSTVHGCDSVVRLHLTILTSETIDESDSTCFLPYHWQTHGHDLGYLYDYGHHTQEVVMGDCYTTFNLDLTEQRFPVPVYFTEEACDSFFWQDSLFTQSTQYELTVPQASGCDSTYVLDLTLHHSQENDIEAVGCNEYNSPWSDSVYTQSGIYTHHYSTVHGCDSIVRLHLSILTSETVNESDSACVLPYHWQTHGQDLGYLYDYGHHTQEVVMGDCYTTFNLDLTEQAFPAAVYFTEEACDLFFWQDSLFTQSTQYEVTVPQASGCDSTYVLDLTLHHSQENDIEAVGCNEYNSPWCDSVYTQSGIYTHHYSTVHGCDSVVRLHLTILTSETIDESDSTCFLPYHWQTHGQDLGYLYDYGHHTQEVVMGDCYTTFNLDLTEQAFPAAVYFTEEACDSFFWQDSLFTQSTQYEVTVPQASGCDSTYVLDLTLHHSQENDIEAVGCNEYNSPWCDSVYTQSGTYTHHYSTVHGCDSVVRLHLTILTSETVNESDSACVLPYHWQTHGHDLGYLYDYGHHTQEVVMGDCYTTFNLDLTEQAFPAAVYFTEEACDSFFWQDSLFTQSTQYEVTVPQASGCDSTYVLDLTLHHSQENDIEAVGCNEYNSPWCDSVYTQSGIYTHHYSTVHGCDSIVRLHLSILTSETIDESDSTCSLPYHWQTHGCDLGYLYDYGHHSQNVTMGDCYTTFNMDLTGQGMPAPVYFREETCDSFFWQDSLFTQSTHYEMSVPQASGCDSTYVLDLRLDYSPDPSEIIPLNTGTPHYVVPSTEFFVMETYYSIQDLVEGSYDSVRWTIEGSDWIVTPYGDSLSCGVHILGYVPDTVWLTARVYNDCAPDGVERRFWLLCSFFGTGEDLSQEVQVYPNPTDSKLTVQGDELRKVSVYDVYGQQVACYDNLSTNMQTIDVKRFAAAMYYVEVTTSRGKTIKKVVVQR